MDGWTNPGKPFDELVERTSTGPPGTQGGTWQIQPVIQPCELIIRERVIHMPTGTSVRDLYVDNAPGMVYRPPGGEVLNGILQLGSRTILDGAVELQREERSYKEVPVVQTGLGVWGTYEVVRRILTRGGQTHTTEYTYDEDRPNAFGSYHRPETIREWTGSGPVRTTALTYDHLSTPFVVGLPLSEHVTVGSQSFAKTWSYDATGFQETATVYGTTTTYTRDALGNVASVRKGSGQPTTFSYSWGQVAAIQTPEHTVDRDVRADGTVASETQAGRITSFQYDDLFRVTRTDPPGGTLPVLTEYDNTTGRSVKVSRGSSPASTSFVITTLDGFGRAIATENSLGVRTSIRHDAEGRKTYEGYPFVPGAGSGDIGVTTTYDRLGRVKRRTNPDNTYAEITYGTGFLTIFDENGRPTTQTFQAFGDPDERRLVSVVDARSQTWTYTLDAIGQLTAVQAPDGAIRTWEYYAGTDRLQRETHPESGTTTYGLYDDAGVLKQKTDANGTTFTYVHDGNDRVIRESAGTSFTSIAYEPGSDNRRLLQTNATSTELVYDPAGRISERRDTIDGRLFTTIYEYDNNDNLLALKYPALQLATVRRRVQFE